MSPQIFLSIHLVIVLAAVAVAGLSARRARTDPGVRGGRADTGACRPRRCSDASVGRRRRRHVAVEFTEGPGRRLSDQGRWIREVDTKSGR